MASNQYGFDFLRSEHTLSDKPPELQNVHIASTSMDEDDNEPPPAIAAAVATKPDGEKQYDVIQFLKAHRSSGDLPPSIIYKATGIDLEETDESVAKLLSNNEKIRVVQVPDPENPSIMLSHYAYQAKYNDLRTRDQLLAQINRCKNGVKLSHLNDSYDGADKDLKALITAGDVIAIHNPEDKDKILFPRGDVFLVELDGIITVPDPPTDSIHPETTTTASSSSTPPLTDTNNATNENSTNDENKDGSNDNTNNEQAKAEEHKKRQLADIYIVDTDVDPRKQIRRGEAVCIGGQWFRISSAVNEGVPLEEQPIRAQAPLSVTSLSDLSSRNLVNGYIRPFQEKKIPLDGALSATARENLRQAREAREKLHKLAGGRSASAGCASKLLSSQAHSANPKTLAASFSSSMGGHGVIGGGMSRKRPSSLHNKASNVAQARKDAEAAHRVASDPPLALYTHARRHGCTKRVREMFLKTTSQVPMDDEKLRDLMIEHKLLEPGEKWKQPKMPKKANVDNDGKPKKKRYYERKNQRMTNVHLLGTEIGAALAEAAERQKQGKAVGDGGM